MKLSFALRKRSNKIVPSATLDLRAENPFYGSKFNENIISNKLEIKTSNQISNDTDTMSNQFVDSNMSLANNDSTNDICLTENNVSSGLTTYKITSENAHLYSSLLDLPDEDPDIEVTSNSDNDSLLLRDDSNVQNSNDIILSSVKVIQDEDLLDNNRIANIFSPSSSSLDKNIEAILQTDSSATLNIEERTSLVEKIVKKASSVSGIIKKPFTKTRNKKNIDEYKDFDYINDDGIIRQVDCHTVIIQHAQLEYQQSVLQEIDSVQNHILEPQQKDKERQVQQQISHIDIDLSIGKISEIQQVPEIFAPSAEDEIRKSLNTNSNCTTTIQRKLPPQIPLPLLPAESKKEDIVIDIKQVQNKSLPSSTKKIHELRWDDIPIVEEVAPFISEKLGKSALDDLLHEIDKLYLELTQDNYNADITKSLSKNSFSTSDIAINLLSEPSAIPFQPDVAFQDTRNSPFETKSESASHIDSSDLSSHKSLNEINGSIGSVDENLIGSENVDSASPVIFENRSSETKVDSTNGGRLAFVRRLFNRFKPTTNGLRSDSYNIDSNKNESGCKRENSKKALSKGKNNKKSINKKDIQVLLPHHSEKIDIEPNNNSHVLITENLTIDAVDTIENKDSNDKINKSTSMAIVDSAVCINDGELASNIDSVVEAITIDNTALPTAIRRKFLDTIYRYILPSKAVNLQDTTLEENHIQEIFDEDIKFLKSKTFGLAKTKDFVYTDNLDAIPMSEKDDNYWAILDGIEELYVSESKYLGQLGYVKDHYYDVFAKLGNKKVLKTLFGSFLPIYNFHSIEIYGLMREKKYLEIMDIYQCFGLYVDYYANFSKALRLLDDKKFKRKYGHLLGPKVPVTDGELLDLRSLLLTPVQRLPRYALLLEYLLKAERDWTQGPEYVVRIPRVIRGYLAVKQFLIMSNARTGIAHNHELIAGWMRCISTKAALKTAVDVRREIDRDDPILHEYFNQKTKTTAKIIMYMDANAMKWNKYLLADILSSAEMSSPFRTAMYHKAVVDLSRDKVIRTSGSNIIMTTSNGVDLFRHVPQARRFLYTLTIQLAAVARLQDDEVEVKDLKNQSVHLIVFSDLLCLCKSKLEFNFDYHKGGVPEGFNASLDHAFIPSSWSLNGDLFKISDGGATYIFKSNSSFDKLQESLDSSFFKRA